MGITGDGTIDASLGPVRRISGTVPGGGTTPPPGTLRRSRPSRGLHAGHRHVRDPLPRFAGHVSPAQARLWLAPGQLEQPRRCSGESGSRWDFSKDRLGQDFVYPFRSPTRGSRRSTPNGPQDLTILALNWALHAHSEDGGSGRPGPVLRRHHRSKLSRLVHQHRQLPDYQVFNDGRPNFASDRSSWPVAVQCRRLATLAQSQGRLMPSLIYTPRTSYGYQTSAGLQHQLSQTMAVQATPCMWVASAASRRNINLTLTRRPG
jgi:hypothetical protein